MQRQRIYRIDAKKDYGVLAPLVNRYVCDFTHLRGANTPFAFRIILQVNQKR